MFVFRAAKETKCSTYVHTEKQSNRELRIVRSTQTVRARETSPLFLSMEIATVARRKTYRRYSSNAVEWV